MHPWPSCPHILASAALILCLGLASCDGGEPTALETDGVGFEPSVPEATLITGSVVNVRDFGARPNDQIDDTGAFAAALSALPAGGGTVRIPAGTFLLIATPRSSIGRGIDIFRRTNITLAGDGMQQTVLRMAPGISYRGDTHVILIEQSSDITVRDLMVDGNRFRVSYGDEQSHGVDVRGSSGVRLQRVIFTGMHGDGVQLIGTLGPTLRWVENVQVEDCLFTHNGRSGIAVQRAVRGLTVTRNTFTRLNDQAVDMEPSDSSIDGLVPHDFAITNNYFFDTATLAVTVAGISSEQPARNVRVANNTFEGAGMLVFNAVNVRIESNVIRSGTRWSPIDVRKKGEKIWIVDNIVDSRATDGPAITISYHTSMAPKDVHAINNTILTSGEPGFYSRDAKALEVVGNRITGPGNTGINIVDVNPDSPLSEFLVERNTISGYRTGIRFATDEDPMREVCVRGNTLLNFNVQLVLDGRIVRDCTFD